MGRWNEYGYFKPSRPRAAKGGIRAQSKRGSFGESWWAKRWTAVLESFNIGARLQRGRSYARLGQVLSIDVAKGSIAARVQGSRATPYKVAIVVKPLSAADWKKVAAATASQALFASKLLGGEMPQEMESAFRTAGVTLFPERLNDLKTDCSCPDWSNPCKHIAAVYYLMGEEFDRDPFLIFRMRGMNRDEFMALLGESGAVRLPVEAPLPPEPLPTAPAAFYAAGPLPEDGEGTAAVAVSGAAVARRLGKFPFWRASTDLMEFLDAAYAAAAVAAAEALEGGDGTNSTTT
jgi:uncharacterized Zn finger protein